MNDWSNRIDSQKSGWKLYQHGCTIGRTGWTVKKADGSYINMDERLVEPDGQSKKRMEAISTRMTDLSNRINGQ